MSEKIEKSVDENALFGRIAELIELSRQKVVAAVNLAMVHTYYEVGKAIVENEQQGLTRARYGTATLKNLSRRLSDRFGKGFSEVNLRQMRQFYEAYSIQQKSSAKFVLSWSHYLILMRIERSEERAFYEIEAASNRWSLRELERQLKSGLFERLAVSKDTETVKRLSEKGQTVEKPQDVIKNPYVLEFLGLKEEKSYSEADLETKIIDHLQSFLLEFGKGFSFVGRQVRFTFDEQHFKVDLIFYNRLLQCFVLVDLKMGKITHQDLGQMQMYVNYYDRFEKLPHEKPTVGILLCQRKNDALVELTLPTDANIYASEYKLYLPDKKLLRQKLNEWQAEE